MIIITTPTFFSSLMFKFYVSTSTIPTTRTEGYDLHQTTSFKRIWSKFIKIINIFNLSNKLVYKIKDYQSKEGLQNEKGLDIYIDQILTEKANKK